MPLTITIADKEFLDERTLTFVKVKGATLQMEHSLVSLQKWESKWEVPFLHTENKTREQVIDYFKCMTLTQNVQPDVYAYMSEDEIKQITDYINRKMTASWFSNTNPNYKAKREIVTAELIYYWMIKCEIPFECRKWHLNQLMTLIQTFSVKDGKATKMSKKEILSQNKARNQMRRARSHSKG